MELSHLNAPQREAVETLSGPVLVLAGAGTGKTTVIAHRVAYMVEQGIAPESILAMTFTNKAAREMQERITGLLPQIDPGQLHISTFHSFCCRVLRKHAGALGRNHSFGIADSDDQVDLARQAMYDTGGKKGEAGEDPFAFLAAISKCKSELKGPEQAVGKYTARHLRRNQQVYQRYEQLLAGMNLVDFDDLLFLTHRLWSEHPNILATYRSQFTHLLVDEYQDTNRAQSALLALLAGQTRNVCVVGDDDQSIYAWRGAEVRNILEFDRQFPGARVIKLEDNYRSTGSILEAANAVIANNRERHGKRLRAHRHDDQLITCLSAAAPDDEARLLAELAEQRHYEGLPYADMAVLFRSNHYSRALEEAFRRQHIPYRLVGAKSFYQRREVKDAVAYLRILHNPRDDQALLRILNVPPRGLGETATKALLAAQKAEHRPLLDVLRDPGLQAGLSPGGRDGARFFLHTYDRYRQEFSGPGGLAQKITAYFESSGYTPGLKRIYRDHQEALDRLENVQEFVRGAREFEERAGDRFLVSLQDFLEGQALVNDSDRTEEEGVEGLTLMTVHAAKGLEFELVMIAGLAEGLFPHERALAEDPDATEERRLFYVALTRAKRSLVISRPLGQASAGGGGGRARPSRFLGELPRDLVEERRGEGVLRKLDREDVGADLADMSARFKARANELEEREAERNQQGLPGL